MIPRDAIAGAIYSAVDELNQQLPKGQKLAHSLETPLFSADGKLDSVAFVSLIVAVEREIQDTFDVEINLTDQTLLSLDNHPFASIGSLVDFISDLLEGKYYERR
jgi:acyl carrier protein